MTRYSAWAVCVVIACSIVGCGQEKELPTEVPKLDSSVGQQQVVPAKSDAEAKAVIDRAVTAFTGGKPDLLAKGKLSRATLKGTMHLPVGNDDKHLETVRTIAAVWPDRYFFINDIRFPGMNLIVESWLRDGRLTIFHGGIKADPANSDEAGQTLASSAVSQHWMAFMLPATDPKAIVFDLQQTPLEHRLKLSLGDHPLFQLTFDPKTDTLARVEYTSREGGLNVSKLLIYSDYKVGPDGLLLPHQIECRHGNRTVEKWTVEKWDFPATIDDKEFTPPKK